jgi:hypothetical protein
VPEPTPTAVDDRGAGTPAPPVDAQTFGEYYYAHDCGIPYERSEHWTTFFGGIADHIIRDLHPTTALDAGCAIGLLVEQLRNRGVDAAGVDISDYAYAQMPDEVREHCWVASLTEPIDRKFDLVTCVEVVEHMPASDVRAAIANLCSVTDKVLLSSSPFDYGEPTHLNVQPPEYWSSLMAANGFVRDFDYDASYLTPWAALYVRHPGGISDVVRDYDRAWWRLREEVQEVRAKVLELQNNLSAQDNEAGEIAQLREELLRLRDDIIGKDAELGGARGHITEMAAQLQRYEGMKQHLEAILGSRSWRLMWAAGTPLRRLRRPAP